VERAEEALKARGFAQCRVRHHGDVARIEVPDADLPRLVATEERHQIVDAIKAVGFQYVALDLQGYRMGSLNLSP